MRKSADQNNKTVFKRMFSSAVVILIAGLVWGIMLCGCGDTPSSPQKVELGSIEIIAMRPDSTLLPNIIVNIDNERIDSGAVPLLIEDLFPGTHNFILESGFFNATFKAEINPGATTVSQPILNEYAADFDLPGLRYDLDLDSLVEVDNVRLSDYLDKVVLLFFFNDG